MRIGSPVTGYGQESRNRAARQRIPNRTWTDEDGVEHVEVTSYCLTSFTIYSVLALFPAYNISVYATHFQKNCSVTSGSCV